MTPWRQHLRRARLALTVLVGVVLIAVAVAMGVFQLLLPLAVRHPDFVAQQLSDRLHRPVHFAAIRSEWQPSGPLLMVRDLTLGPGHPGGQSITLPHAALKFDFGAWLRPAQRWITLRLNGVELRVERTATGWQVAGFGSAAGAPHASLQSLPVDLDLRNLHVDIVDDVLHRQWQLLAPRLRVVNVGGAVRFGGVVQQVGTRQAVTVNGRMQAAQRDFDLHVVTHGFDFATALQGFDLHGYAVRGARGDVELWGRWRDGKLVSAATRYALAQVAINGPDGRSATVPTFAGVLQATRVADGWNLAWRGPGAARATIDQAGGALVQLRGHAGAWQVTAAARDIALQPWLHVLALAPAAPKALADWVAQAHPGVRIERAAVVWKGQRDYSATLRFADLHAVAVGKIPGLSLARGTLRADPQAVALTLPTQAATIALTHVFRTPFVFKQLAGKLVAWREDGDWNVAVDGLHFDTGSLAGNAHARLTWLGRGQPPFLSAYAAIDHANLADAKLFWPSSMPRHLVAWLDRALVSGKVTTGRVLVRGPLAAWPFVNHEGRFEATGVIEDTTFDFADGWPPATDVGAAVDFVDNRMAIVATHVQERGVTATRAVAVIPDLAHGVLGLDIRGNGGGAQLLDFVRHSPVGADAAEALDGLSVSGTGAFGLQLSIPLDDASKFSLAGKVDLAKADVSAPKWNLKLDDLSGPLVLAGKGFTATDLPTTFRGAPATLSLAVGSGVTDPADIVEASLDTNVSAQTLLQGYPDLAGLAAHASGVAPFHVAVAVAAGQGGAPAVPMLTVQSSLAGIALDFPVPLDKPPATTLPLTVTLRLPPAGAPLTVSLGDVLQVRGRLADPATHTPTALAFNFGATPPASVPASGSVVAGSAPRMDITGWIQQALQGAADPSFPAVHHVDVSTAAADVFGTDLGALHFGFDAGTTTDAITFDGPALKGTLELPTANLMTRGITAKLARLHWPEPPPPKHPGPPPRPSATSPIAPSAIPPLNVTVGDLKLGAAQLGATTFVSMPSATGMHIQQFDTKGADFSIKAHGDWTGNTMASQSHLVIDMASRDFGKTLAAFGFSGLLAGGEHSELHIDGTWPGAPTGFSLAWMNGTLGIKVGEGRILAVKPGLGRVLGLLSLRDLPSRLMLHFGDVFKSGFGFDHASAQFTLRDGNAYTQDMLITAPSARITLQGRTGFRARDFDLDVHVTPHVGGTLPVVGAVIGGPVGAAAGLVVQGIIGKSINEAAGTTYHVTGGWDKPKIASVESAPAAAASTAPAPASSGAAPAVATSVAAAATVTTPASAASVPAAAATAAPAPAATVASTPVSAPASAASSAVPPSAATVTAPASGSSTG